MADEERSSVERLIGRSLADEQEVGRPISHRARHARRSVEAYLRAGVRPRWMERLIEIDRGMKREKLRLRDAYEALRAETPEDAAAFAAHWRATAERWRFDELNELIAQHNEWYPIERDLPMDPRTGDYVPIHGRSYRRPILGPAWILEQFPPRER
jgi:hypothetical protein